VLDGDGAYFAKVAVRRLVRGRGRAAVLIIAEDAVAREVYAELFAMRGYGVVTATGARDGLKRARDRAIATVVLVLQQGSTQLRRKLHALRPTLRIHVTGLSPLCFDVMAPLARQSLH
jgi:ActR/RegA family two-component response regulator